MSAVSTADSPARTDEKECHATDCNNIIPSRLGVCSSCRFGICCGSGLFSDWWIDDGSHIFVSRDFWQWYKGFHEQRTSSILDIYRITHCGFRGRVCRRDRRFTRGRCRTQKKGCGKEEAERASVGLTPRWSQRRLPLEFMDGLSYTTIIEPAEPLARRRGSALDR